MGFDVEGYRKAAKEAGFSDEEIQKDIDEETQGVAAKGADANMDNVKVGKDFMGVPEWLQPAAGLATGAALGAGALKGGQKLKERMAAPSVQPAPRVEPTFGIPDIDPNAQPQNKFTPPQGDVTDVVAKPVVQAPTAPAAPVAAAPAAPAPAPVGVPAPAPQVAMPGAQQPQMQYGATTTNAPTGVPNPVAPVAPPAEVAPAPVQPKPMTEIERLRAEKLQFDLEAARNKEARAQEAHATRMANEAKRAEAKNQTQQGKPVDSVETTMQKQSHQNTISKAVAADVKATTPAPKPAPAASVAPPVAAPAAPVAVAPAPAAPVVAAPATVAPVAAVPKAAAVPPAPADSLTKEQKGMKNYLVSQYGGGPEGEAAYKKTIDILGEVPAYEKGQGGGLSKEANNAIKDWRKANIEGPKVNLTHEMKKVMKGAGGLAILTALPGFAEAAQRKDVGKMSDIFTDFFVLPFAQSRGTNEGEEQELAKRRYEGAVGGGRGIAPPSAYQR